MEEERKWVDLSKLPTKNGKGKNKNKHVIDWINSVDYKVDFTYNNISGIITIIKYQPKTQILTIKCMNKIFEIKTGNFTSCKFAKLLNAYPINRDPYKYGVGETLTQTNGILNILKQIRITDEKYTKKGYEYQCLTCNHIGTIKEYDICRGHGCPVCSGRIAKKGLNDMWTTDPDIASMLANPNDGYRYKAKSNIYTNWICPNCGEAINNKAIAMVSTNGLSCPKCSCNNSYPNRFLYNLFKQIEITNCVHFTNEKTFKWSFNRKYDGYEEQKNCIIEMHGAQHYVKDFESYGGRTLKEEQDNDKFKKYIAYKNGVQHYITIDARKSTMKWIKSSILNSELPLLYDLSKVDWNLIHQESTKNIVKIASDLWGQGNSIPKIMKALGKSRGAVTNYLKQGSILSWNTYDPKHELDIGRKKNSGINKIRIICITTEITFNSITEVESELKINHGNISMCCIGKRNFAGKLPDGTPLHWMYYDEYIKLSDAEKEELHNKYRVKEAS